MKKWFNTAPPLYFLNKDSMTYNQKLLEEHRKYGAVTCKICKKRKRYDWNIYSANTFCSHECSMKAVAMLLSDMPIK